MKKEFYHLLILGLLVLFVPACSSSNEEPLAETEGSEESNDNGIVDNPCRDIVLSRTEKELAALNTEFAFRLLQVANEELKNQGQHESILLSPQSASYALSMLANGAADETQTEIMKVLGFDEFTLDEMNKYNQKLMKGLVELDNTTTVNMANSLWLDNEFKALDDYKKVLKEAYEAEVFVEDFAQRGTMGKINEWCSEKTDGCIPHFLKEWNEDGKTILANALYFKGKWLMPFEKKDTGKGVFTLASGQSENVDFMRQTANNPYMKNEHVSVAQFAYGNGAFSMYIVLPHEGILLDEWVKSFDAGQWAVMLEGMKLQKMNVWLPKFKLERDVVMNDMLHALGLAKAFDAEEADFSALSDEYFWIDRVMQATYISIDEEGTEGAAVTGAGWLGADLEKEESTSAVDFHANHPFLFVLQEKSTGTVLFLGKFGGVEK